MLSVQHYYPQPRLFYELCDELGFYVYHEANIESHGMGYNLREGGTLANNRDFYALHQDRIINMYERCKNYACVTILSSAMKPATDTICIRPTNGLRSAKKPTPE